MREKRRIYSVLTRTLASSFLLLSSVLIQACSRPSPSVIKSEIYAEFRLSIKDSGILNSEQLVFLQDQLRFGPLRGFLPFKLKVIQIRAAIPGVAQPFGAYDPVEEVIYLSADEDRFEESVIHEIFHVLSYQCPASYLEFLKVSGWSIEKHDGVETFIFSWMDSSLKRRQVIGTEFDFRFEPESFQQLLDFPIFPSDYSKVGPAEMFAEVGTAATLILMNRVSAHYDLERFSKTPLAQWTIDFIARGCQNR